MCALGCRPAALRLFGGMAFWKDISPSGAVADIVALWRRQDRMRYLLLVAACLPVAIMIYGFYIDMAKKATPPPPQVIYIESWSLDRSREEIIADQQKRLAEREKREAAMRERYKQLGEAFGMDRAALERDAEKIRADTAAREAARQQADKAPAKAP